MSKTPKKSDYQASASEKANAEIAQSEYARFKTKYAPLLKIRAETSQTDDTKKILRGRASADVAQSLSKTSMQAAESPDLAGNMAEAYTGQLAEANRTALAHKNDVGLDVLAKARQQAGRAQQGLSEVARLSTSSALAKAQAKQDVAQAKWNAAAQLGSSFARAGIENMSQTGDFFTPGNLDFNAKPDPVTGKPSYIPAKSWEDRLSAGLGRF